MNNNLNSSYTYTPTPSFIPKGKFYKLILEDIQKFFIKERNINKDQSKKLYNIRILGINIKPINSRIIINSI